MSPPPAIPSYLPVLPCVCDHWWVASPPLPQLSLSLPCSVPQASLSLFSVRSLPTSTVYCVAFRSLDSQDSSPNLDPADSEQRFRGATIPPSSLLFLSSLPTLPSTILPSLNSTALSLSATFLSSPDAVATTSSLSCFLLPF